MDSSSIAHGQGEALLAAMVEGDCTAVGRIVSELRSDPVAHLAVTLDLAMLAASAVRSSAGPCG